MDHGVTKITVQVPILGVVDRYSQYLSEIETAIATELAPEFPLASVSVHFGSRDWEVEVFDLEGQCTDLATIHFVTNLASRGADRFGKLMAAEAPF